MINLRYLEVCKTSYTIRYGNLNITFYLFGKGLLKNGLASVAVGKELNIIDLKN